MYSRSIAEVVHRILHITESNYEEEISQKISQTKQTILYHLLEQLNCKREDETVLNAAFILRDLLEQKQFFQSMTKKQNMRKLFETAFQMSEIESDNCNVTQGLITKFIQQFNDRSKMN